MCVFVVLFDFSIFVYFFRVSWQRDSAFGHSAKIDGTNNSPALNHFLEDVLNAQEELKWIDRAVHRSAERNADSSSRRRYPRYERSFIFIYFYFLCQVNLLPSIRKITYKAYIEFFLYLH